MPRVTPSQEQSLRVAAQARASASYRAEKRVQEAEEAIQTVSGGIPPDLTATIGDYELRIEALESAQQQP